MPGNKMSDYLSLSEKILDLTRAMAAAAEAEQWDKVRMQEEQRQRMLKDMYIGGGAAGNDNGRIAANLEETVKLNARLIDLGAQATGDLAKVIGDLQRGRKARRAYNDAG